MALGKNRQDGTLVILVPTFKEDKVKCMPHFKVKRKVDGVWVTDPDGVSNVTGDLVKIDIEEKEWEGSPYNEVKLFMKDEAESELYLIDMRFGIASRALFNALINLKDFTNFTISVYENDNGYPNFGVWQNDTLIRWKYDLSDIPAPEETTFKGKKMRDFSEADEFFSKKLMELNEKVTGSKSTPKAKDPDAPEAPDAEEDPEDDIPF